MKKIVVTMISVFVLAITAFAAEVDKEAPEAAEGLLKESMGEVLTVLEDSDLEKAEKKKRIEAIVDPVFNYELIARLSLGPRNWPRLDQEQRDIFMERFVERMKDAYFENIAMFEGDAETKIDYGEMQVENKRVRIPVRASMGDSSADILYKFHYSEDGGWLVYDVEINGVSIVSSYRSQFSQVLADYSVDEMLERIKSIEAPAAE